MNSTRMTYPVAFVSVGLVLAALVLFAPAASAAPTPVSSCQMLASPGAYELTADLAAIDATCIEISASNVKLDLAGHTISCTGSGFAGGCQVPAFGSHGVRVAAELDGVAVRGPGTITGFDQGVAIMGSDAQVKGVTITAPACDPSDCQRPIGSGIFVSDATTAVFPPSPVSANVVGNDVSNYERGIALWGIECPGPTAACAVRKNVTRHNDPCLGMLVLASSGYTLADNVIRSNGSPSCSEPPGGIVLGFGATANVLTGNDISANTGYGIFVSNFPGTPDTNGNTIVNNTAKGNSDLDLFASAGSTNTWNDNNRCHTEGGAVPSSVCNAGE